MMGVSHGASGLLAGLLLGQVVGAPPAVAGMLGAVAMVGSYVPDIDHPSSTVTRAVPVLGRVASWLARGASKRLYAMTKGPADEDWEGGHRHATHTLLFAAGFGLLVGVGASAGGVPWATWVGVAAGLGCFVHCLGDAATISGCPFLFPLPIAGETWFELGPPAWMRFRTNGPFERLVMMPALCVCVVLAAPGVWPVINPVS